jgi:hypothetical protein
VRSWANVGDSAHGARRALERLDRAGLPGTRTSQPFLDGNGTLEPDVRAAAFSTGAVQGEFTAPWADAEITIDGTSVGLRRLGDDGYWLAQARHGRLLVGIESRGWPVESIGLVTIEDLTPYIKGFNRIAAVAEGSSANRGPGIAFCVLRSDPPCSEEDRRHGARIGSSA